MISHPSPQADMEAMGYVTKMLTQRKVGAHVLTHAELSREQVPNVLDQLAYRLSSYVLTEHIATDHYERTVSFDWPESWWQHFKMTYATSWWLGWLIERRPVRTGRTQKTARIEVERSFAYPEARIVAPLGRPIRWEQIR